MKLVGSGGINEKLRGYLKRVKLKFQKLKGQKGKLAKPGSVNTAMAASHLPSPISAVGGC